MPVAKEQIRQIIADNNLHSGSDVHTSAHGDSFKDILQELMEAETGMITWLLKKSQRLIPGTSNKRNVVIHQKHSKPVW